MGLDDRGALPIAATLSGLLAFPRLSLRSGLSSRCY